MLFRLLLVGTALLGVFAVSINGLPHDGGFEMCYLCTTFFTKAITLFKLGDRPKFEASFSKYCDTFEIPFEPIKDECKSFVDIALHNNNLHKDASPDMFCQKEGFCNKNQATFLPIMKFTESLEWLSEVEKDKYLVVEKKMSVNDATRFCKSKGMRLVSIRNQHEIRAVQFTLLSQAIDYSWTFWTSGKRFGSEKDSYWKWSDEEVAWPAHNKPGQNDGRFRNWYPGEPNNAGGHEHCIQMGTPEIFYNNLNNLRWKGSDCSFPLSVICEKV